MDYHKSARIGSKRIVKIGNGGERIETVRLELADLSIRGFISNRILWILRFANIFVWVELKMCRRDSRRIEKVYR